MEGLDWDRERAAGGAGATAGLDGGQQLGCSVWVCGRVVLTSSPAGVGKGKGICH